MGRGLTKYLGYLRIYRLYPLNRQWLVVGYTLRQFLPQFPDCNERSPLSRIQNYGYYE
jgi:hypothetical protein